MICPVCGFDNLQGEDNCQNCGADLRNADIPQAASWIERQLLIEPCRALKPPLPVVVSIDASVQEVVDRLKADSGAGVVIEQDGRVVGIFTERDVVQKLAGASLKDLTVDQVMTRDPVVLRADDSIAVAINKMAVGGFRHIPLVDGGSAVGMITAHDLFRFILKLMA